jgi:hypothetical protein
LVSTAAVVRVPRRVFQRLLPERPTPERCVEAYYLQRTRFEGIAEQKTRRQLTDDAHLRADRSHGLPQTAAIRADAQLSPKMVNLTASAIIRETQDQAGLTIHERW